MSPLPRHSAEAPPEPSPIAQSLLHTCHGSRSSAARPRFFGLRDSVFVTGGFFSGTPATLRRSLSLSLSDEILLNLHPSSSSSSLPQRRPEKTQSSRLLLIFNFYSVSTTAIHTTHADLLCLLPPFDSRAPSPSLLSVARPPPPVRLRTLPATERESRHLLSLCLWLPHLFRERLHQFLFVIP